MVWGTFGYSGFGNIVILPKSIKLNTERYIQLLENNLAECFAKTGTEILQQEGARCYTSRAAKNWFSDNEIDIIEDWPGHTRDISPIKNLWGIMKGSLWKLDTSTVPKLEIALCLVCGDIPPSHCQNLAASVPQHLHQVIKAKGFPIPK